jgi:hypothetical protein
MGGGAVPEQPPQPCVPAAVAMLKWMKTATSPAVGEPCPCQWTWSSVALGSGGGGGGVIAVTQRFEKVALPGDDAVSLICPAYGIPT